MSICRFAIPGRRCGLLMEYVVAPEEQCDIYMYVSSDSELNEPLEIQCCGCKLLPDPGEAGAYNFHYLHSWAETRAHVQCHIDRGHKVPDWVLRHCADEEAPAGKTFSEGEAPL